jgi:death caspase-1
MQFKNRLISRKGFVAWREDSGSWFMQALCELLLSSGSKLDLLTLLTLVTQKVAIDFESNCPSTLSYHRKKQIPSTITMLTRLLIFTPSPN